MFNLSVSLRSRMPSASVLLLGAALLTVSACGDDDLVGAAPSVGVPVVSVTPRSTSLRVGATQQLAATVKTPEGVDVPNPEVVWATGDSTIATVSATGLVTVRSPGTAGITARYRGGEIGSASITVLGPVSGITLTSPATSLTVGLAGVQLNAQTFDAAGLSQSRVVTYTSNNPAVATVNAGGGVTAVSAGTATITAASEGQSASVNLTVLPPIPVVLSPSATTFTDAVTQQLTVVVRDPVSGAIINNPTVTYSSSNTAIATVNATGLVTLVGSGTATITATSGGRTGTATVTGNALPLNTPVVISGALNSSRDYLINVPAGTTRLTVTLANTTQQDADLEIYAPGVAARVCASENAASNESCVVNNPVAGVYRARVIGFTVYADVTIRAVTLP